MLEAKSAVRVLDCRWRQLSPEERQSIQATNADISKPFDLSGFEYLVQRGLPPDVAIAWEPAKGVLG